MHYYGLIDNYALLILPYMTSGLIYQYKHLGGRRGRDRMVVAFTATCVINAYRYKVVSSKLDDGEVHSRHHYLIQFVSDL